MIQLTQTAANKIAELLQESQNPNLHLRIYITGGGCSGFQYGFTFDEQITDDDMIIEKTSTHDIPIKVLIDAMSFQYLQGATIDFSTGVQEEFIINNPNAKTTCGCGSSFSIEENDEKNAQ